MSEAEFDQFSEEYHKNLDHPIRTIVGGSNLDWFQQYRAKYIVDKMQQRFLHKNDTILDFGCGTGTLLRCLREEMIQRKPTWKFQLFGVDVSQGMLDQIQREWPHDAEKPHCSLIKNAHTSFQAHSFDVIIASSVFHHIPHSEHPAYFQELHRILKPGGWLFFIEHNPFNPITQWVVKHTPVDKNAVLLYPHKATRMLHQQQFSQLSTEYILFFPSFLSMGKTVEKYMKWIPLGGQYVILGSKDE